MRKGPLLAGVVLLLIYARMWSALGFQATYGPVHLYEPGARLAFSGLGGGEARFFLAHLVFAIPAALLIGWGLAPRLAPALQRLAARVDAATPKQWLIAGVVLFVALSLYYALGRILVLDSRPITDDENGVAFGARILAAGKLTVPLLKPAGAFTDMFTFQRDGLTSSFDFPGTLAFGALAQLAGDIVYALASAASAIAIAYAAKRWLGPRGALLAAAIWIASPMVGALSLTSHPHVFSRLWIAVALAFAARVDLRSSKRDAILFGVAVGLAFICRPFETLFALAPVAGWLLWKRRAWLAFAGALPFVIAFAWYNAQTTGTWWLQARFGPGVVGAQESLSFSVADRVGLNLGWNLAMLAVFFLGIPMIAAAIGGLDRKRPAMLVLGASVAGQLALCLLHDNTGVHSVGPIHLSETVVPLTLLVAAGLLRGFAFLSSRRGEAGVVVAAYLALGCGAFGLTNCASLHASASRQQMIYDALDELNIHHAIVMTPSYAAFPAAVRDPAFTWMLQYPHPDPFFRDDVIFAHNDADIAALRRAFPDRKLYAMTYAPRSPTIRVAPVE